MIKNIIFDFGDVFINLDKEVIFRQMETYGGRRELAPELIALNESYEVGAIDSDTFIESLVAVYPKASAQQIVDTWNAMLLDLPEYRLEFLEGLAAENNYRLFLLSNTNALHIPHFERKIGAEKFNRFKRSFEKFYLSHEIHLRKPNRETYEFVLDENGLLAEETFFIDDTKENTDAAAELGISCWNLRVGTDDIIHLKDRL